MNRSFLAGLAAATLATLASLTSAHEFWIQPAKFHAAVGDSVGIQLLVGDGFPGEVRPRDPKRLEQFVLIAPSGKSDIQGEDGESPAGSIRLTEVGTHLIGYRGRPSSIEMTADKFEEYLKAEGLEHVIEARKSAGESSKGAKENFSRAAKSLITVGEGSDDQFSVKLGYPSEIVPAANPAALKAGEPFAFTVLFDGKPQEGAQVKAFFQGDVKHILVAKSDSQGRVEFALDRPGMWMLSTVKMTRGAEGSGADWESVWASLTFEIQAAESSSSSAK